jgi:hypothetical protein
MSSITPLNADRGISDQQAPATGGSPCCGANIVDAQTLMTARIYRACAQCGRGV